MIKELSLAECHFVSGGIQDIQYLSADFEDSGKILSSEGVGILAGVGVVSGVYLGTHFSSYPFFAGMLGGVVGALIVPIGFHFAIKGLLNAYEISGII